VIRRGSVDEDAPMTPDFAAQVRAADGPARRHPRPSRLPQARAGGLERLPHPPWLAVATRWATEIKPALTARNRQLRSVEVATLDDDALGRRVTELLEHCRANAELHFWLHGHDLGPIALNSAGRPGGPAWQGGRRLGTTDRSRLGSPAGAPASNDPASRADTREGLFGGQAGDPDSRR
jgi:hypothetical protein